MTKAGTNERNGVRTKTVITEIGPVQIDVPRDRDGTFEPVIVKKRQRRLDGVLLTATLAQAARGQQGAPGSPDAAILRGDGCSFWGVLGAGKFDGSTGLLEALPGVVGVQALVNGQ